MILTFSSNDFVEAIKAGTKIHTIREDKKGRWKSGMKIHFWRGNPRNVKSNPYQFGEGTCKNVRDILIDFKKENVWIYDRIAIRLADFSKLDKFAIADGFQNWDCMKEWFYDKYPGITLFEGKIIYFEFDRNEKVTSYKLQVKP